MASQATPERRPGPTADAYARNPEYPHGMHGSAVAASTAEAAYRAAMDRMHGPMMEGIANADPDTAFVLGMIPHHQGAIDMAETVLKFGKDAKNQHFERAIIEHPETRDRRDARVAKAKGHPATVRSGAEHDATNLHGATEMMRVQ